MCARSLPAFSQEDTCTLESQKGKPLEGNTYVLGASIVVPGTRSQTPCGGDDSLMSPRGSIPTLWEKADYKTHIKGVFKLHIHIHGSKLEGSTHISFP